jgi:Bacterial regulatory protein, Fis family
MPKTAIRTYKVFISHSYRRRLHADYLGLVALLNEYAHRHPEWSWENVSIPIDAPVLKRGEARYFDTYVRAMRSRTSIANAILLILRPESTNSESIFIEDWEATPRRRENPPIIGVLPPNQSRDELGPYGGEGRTVPWDANRIVAAVRSRAKAATADELKLSSEEAVERAGIVAALESNDWKVVRAAASLGIGRTTIWRKMRLYVIDGAPAQPRA